MSKIPEGAKWFFTTTFYDLFLKENYSNSITSGPESLGYRPITEHPDYVAPSQETIKQIEWDGTTLPPVGTMCEYKHVHEWLKISIFAIKPNYDGSQTALFTYENGTWSGCTEPKRFRPIRTAEQIAAEERENKAIELFETIHPGGKWDNLDNGMKAQYRAAITLGWERKEEIE